MPANSLPFAVFVGRQIEVFGVFHQALELADLGRFLGGDDIERGEVAVNVHAQPRPAFFAIFVGNVGGLFRQITNVPDAGLDREIAAEELADRAGLRRRFDDHQRFSRTGC